VLQARFHLEHVIEKLVSATRPDLGPHLDLVLRELQPARRAGTVGRLLERSRFSLVSPQ
jgi:hypothetical protein